MNKYQCPKCKKVEAVWDNTAKKYYCMNCDKNVEVNKNATTKT